MHPPHQPKSNDFGRKISLYFEQFGSISGCIPPHQPQPEDSGRKTNLYIGKDLIFFFWRSPDFGRKKRLNFRLRPKNHPQFWWRPFFFFFWRPPDFGRKKRMNFRFRPKNHSQFRWRHPNFWGYVLKIPPHQNFLDPPLAGHNSRSQSVWLYSLQREMERKEFCFYLQTYRYSLLVFYW